MIKVAGERMGPATVDRQRPAPRANSVNALSWRRRPGLPVCRPDTGPCHRDILRFVAAGVDPLAAHLAYVLERQGWLGDVSTVFGLARSSAGCLPRPSRPTVTA